MNTPSEQDARTVARRRRAEALLSLIERRKPRMLEEFYEIGEALRELRDHKLHRALNLRSFRDLIESRRVMGHTQAHKLISIVEELSREQAASLGQERSYALISYAATQPSTNASKLLSQDAASDGVSLSLTSARALRAAAVKARARAARRAETPTERAAREALIEAANGVRAALNSVGLRRTRVEINTEGTIQITLGDVQARRLVALLETAQKAD